MAEKEELPPELQTAIDEAEQAAAAGEAEVPSIFSTTQRYLVGRLGVGPPAEDGSRIIQIISGNGGTVIELNLASSLCNYMRDQLDIVEVIPAEDVEEDGDAGSGTD